MDYDIQMKPVWSHLDKISIDEAKGMSDHPWFNRTLCTVNNSAVRIGVFDGEFHWHSHDREDEFFLVLDGSLEIDVENHEAFSLNRLEGVVIPRGVRHRPRAPRGATVLMVELDSITPTGD